jgi:hypothetical protein
MAIFQDLNASVTPVRPVEQPSAIGAVADLLKGSGFFDKRETTKPTEGEAYEAEWNTFLADEKRVLQPGDPGYGDWLRTTSIKFVSKKPQFAGKVKSNLEAQGIAIPVDPETSEQDARQALYTTWSSSPVGMVAESNAKRAATDKNGTLNPKVFEAEIDKAFAKHITVQAELAQQDTDVKTAENRKTLGQTYWNKGKYFADEAVLGQVNVLADLVEDVRDGSAMITPEMSEVLGLPAGKVTTENFSTLLNKYRPVLIQSLIANTANTLASSGNVDITVLEENPPSAEWITAVMGPIDEVIKAGQNFDSAAEVVKNMQDTDLITAFNGLTPKQRSVISISQLMPPELRSRVYEISNDVNWKETADKVALMFTAENPPEVIIEDISNMSTTDANNAALVAAGALDTGGTKGPTLRSSVLTLFAGSNRVDPSQDLGIETFSALSKNSAGINQEAAMDPAFKAAVVDNVLADITKSFKKYGNLLKGQANIAYTVDDKGNVSIVPDVVGDPEMGVDFNTMQAVEMVAEQLNNSEVALTFTRKLAELDKLGAVGAEIKETFLTVNGLNIGAGETVTAGGAGSGSASTANQITYALPEAIAADTEFLDKVVSVSSELGFDPNDLLRVIDFETAGSFSPKAQPIRKDGTKISSATGLIQFLEKTANGLGTTTAELAGMTAVEQLDFVKAYFEPFKGRIKNFGDIYMAVHWPAGVGKDDSYVMYKAGSDSYKANKGLDTNGDGTVTRGETLARLFSATGKGGNPTAGTPANENTVAAAAGPAVQRAVTSTSGAPMTMPSGGAPAAPMATGEAVDATLPEAIPAETPTGTQGASELSPAIAVDKDVQAFIQEIAGDPDKTYASAEEFTAAQERGELEPGDTVVVNEEIYVIRKDGSARKLGSLTP